MSTSALPVSSRSRITVLASSPGHLVASVGPVLVVLWKQQMQPEVCRQLYDLAERLSRSVGSKVSAVSMIQHTEGAPSIARSEERRVGKE